MAILTHKDNFHQGLVHDQNTFVRDFSWRRVVQLELLNDAHSIALVPHVEFFVNVGKNGLPSPCLQCPFLVTVCYVPTINESQGRTLSGIGLGCVPRYSPTVSFAYPSAVRLHAL